jgi:hypothetical protein
VWLLAKPGAACITDYSVSTPLSFERNGSTGNELEGARLELTVHLEVAASELLQQPGGLAVVADVLLLDGTPLLRDRALAVEQVCVCVLVCVGVTALCLGVALLLLILLPTATATIQLAMAAVSSPSLADHAWLLSPTPPCLPH